jgi:hypothetical protein
VDRRLVALAVVGAGTIAGARVSAADPTSPLDSSVRLSAVAVCERHDPACDWMATLSSLERQSMVRALADKKLAIDPSPWGKTISRVAVFNDRVLAEGGSFIEFFNHFHVVTKEAAIRDELVIGAGEVWDQARVDESARRLHDPLYSSVVAAVPCVGDDPQHVVLLVVTRDIWSLRFNTNYTFQQGSLTNLNISLSENNFLGTRNIVAGAVTMDEGALAVGPLFLDKNLAGEHINLSIRVDDILTRQAVPVISNQTGAVQLPPTGDPTGLEDAHRFHSEGTDSTISISRPLWELASEWGAGASFSHSFGVARIFQGAQDGIGLRSFACPDDGVGPCVPDEYEIHRINASANVVRQWGYDLKQQLSLGDSVSYQAPFFLPSFTTDPDTRTAFAEQVMPPKQTDSGPYVEYSFFEPRYAVFRNVGTYDLAEDAQFGGSLDASVQYGLEALGSTHDFLRYSLSGGYTLPWARDGSLHAGAAASIRRQQGEYIDNTASYQLRVITPSTKWGRIVFQQSLFTRWHDTQNASLSLGSDSGLRGYNVAELFVFGSGRILSGLVEARSTPYPVWVLRLGAVAFYEVGGVSNALDNMTVFHDVGFGLRMLIPQASRALYRFDVAFPLRTDPGPFGTQAGSFHFIAGFDSYF